MRLGVRGKLLAVFFGIVLVVVIVSGIILSTVMKAKLESSVEAELWRHARMARVLLDNVSGDWSIEKADALADTVGEAIGDRITIILKDGRVVGDSELTPVEVDRIENHGDRSEVSGALEDGQGISRRYSTTMEGDLLYCALRFGVNETIGVVRVARPLMEAQRALTALYSVLVVAGLIGLALAVLMGAAISHYFTRALRKLVDFANSAVKGKRTPIPPYGENELGGLAGSVQILAEELGERLDDLAAERNLFGAVLEGMNEAVIALDKHRRVTLINDAGIHLLGLGEQPIGKTILETIRVLELNELLNEVEPGKNAKIEFDFGSPLRRRVMATASRREEGDYVIVFLDVTELRRLEALKRDFVSNVSHELRTPVSIIKANAETLLDGAMDDREAADRFLKSLIVNAERLSSLISDLLDLSRIEEGKYGIEIEQVLLRPSLHRAAAAIETQAIEKGVGVTIEPCGDLKAQAHAKGLDQILFNLVDNAVKYTRDGGNVQIRAALEDHVVRIEVEDDGPGIEPQFRGRLFERFFRVDKGRSREMGGTGLGLAIVKHLVTAMGGKVGMRSAEGGGSIFWVSLPCNGG